MAGQLQNRLPADRTTKKKLSKAGQKTAEDILVAAESLFSRKGFKATTLKEVSDESGANTALISYYFGNKDGLRDAVFTRQLKKAGSGFELMETLSPESLTVDSFKALIRMFLDRSEIDDTLFRLVNWATVDRGEIADKMATAIWMPFYSKLIDYVEALSKGRLTRQEAECRTWAVVGSVHGYVHCRWHDANHMKFVGDTEAFFNCYKELIVDKVTVSLLEA